MTQPNTKVAEVMGIVNLVLAAWLFLLGAQDVRSNSVLLLAASLPLYLGYTDLRKAEVVRASEAIRKVIKEECTKALEKSNGGRRT